MGMSSYIFDEQDRAEKRAKDKAMTHFTSNALYINKDYAVDWVEDNWTDFLTPSEKQLFGED